MIKDLKKTFGHTFYYSISNFSTKLVGLILLPLYTTYLSPAEYGMYIVIEITSFILIDSLTLHFPTAMMRWSANTKDESERKKIVFTSFLPLAVISLMLLLALPFSGVLSEFFFGSNKYSLYFNYLIFISSTAIINQFQLALLRYLEKSKTFLLVNVIRFFIVVLMNYYLLIYMNLGVEGVLLSQLSGYVFVFVATIRFTISNMNFVFIKKTFKEISLFIYPLVISSVLLSLLSNIDKYIIKFILGDAAVGIYTIGFRIASVINVVFIQSFQLGYVPYAFKKLNDSNAKRFFSKVLTYYTFVITMVVLLISIFASDILNLMAKNSEYLKASVVIPFILFSFIFKGTSFIFSMGFHFAKKTAYNSITASITFVSGLIFYYFSAKLFGIEGVAASNIIVFLLNSVLALYFAQKFYPIQYEISKVLKVIFIALFIYCVIIIIPTYSYPLVISLKILLIISIPFILKWINFYEPIELERANHYFRKYLSLIGLNKKASN